MKAFCLPADFKFDTLDQYAELNANFSSANTKVIETYGQLAPDTLFGSCRLPQDLPSVDAKTLEKYIQYSKDKGIEFNYIINATCMGNEELTRTGLKKIEQFLKLLQDLGVDWITLSLPSLMEIAQAVTPRLKIVASTVCQINSPRKAMFYEELGIKRLVLDEDIHRKFDVLKNIRQVYSGELEIITNSFCLNDCPYKMFHYNYFSHSNDQKNNVHPYFNQRCIARHLGADTYLKLNWVRPEDLHYYTDLGVNYFKLQGRTNVFTGNPAKAAKAYMAERYDGNLITLLELFSTLKPLTLVDTVIDNRSLDGFFDKFAQYPNLCSKVCDQCGYCESYAKASISPAHRFLLDIGKSVNDIILENFPEDMK